MSSYSSSDSLLAKRMRLKLRRLEWEQSKAASRIASQTETSEATRALAAEGDFSGYVDDYAGFCRDILGILVWSRQIEMANTVATDPKKLIAYRSGQKTGKTTGNASIALWWIATRRKGVVLVTSSSGSQLKNQLWKEIRRLFEDPKLEDRLAIAKTARTLKELLGADCSLDPATGIRVPDGRAIFGFSTNKTDRAGGYSGAELLILADEASGIDASIGEALEGNCVGGGRLLATGNPLEPIGWFFDIFQKRQEAWVCRRIDSRETPNCTGKEPPIPGLAEPSFLAGRARDWGEASPMFQARVAGNFPDLSTNTVISLGVVTGATQRWECGEQESDDALSFGVDVARFGDDDSVIRPRRGRVAFPDTVVHGLDTQEVAAKVLDLVRTMRIEPEKPKVKVDTIGVGAGVADALRQYHGKELILIEVNVSETADDEEKYSNLRTQLWFGLADWLTSAAMPPDDRTEDELRAPVYGFDSRGRRKVESKDEIKKRLHRSPDRADALALAVYEGGAMPIRAPKSTGGYRQTQRGF